ncbi:MAG: TonB-dependent receptor plug domain-containing protein [Planctomycetota bacterium]
MKQIEKKIIIVKVSLIIVAFINISLILKANEKYIEIELPPVEVTSTLTRKEIDRTPYDVSIVQTNEIKEKGFRSITEVIQSIEGSLAREYGNRGMLATSSLRAGNSTHTLVLIDGKRVNAPSLGLIDLNAIPVPIENIERIEVLKGSASSIYGSEAIGGVINIITKKIDRNYIFSNTYFGSLSTYHKEIQASLREKKTGFSIGLIHENSEGFRPNSEYEIKTLNSKLQYFFNDQTFLELRLDTLVNDAGTPGSISFPSLNANTSELSTLFAINFSSPLLISNLYFYSFTTHFIDTFSDTTTKNFVYTLDTRKTFLLSDYLTVVSGLEFATERYNNIDFKNPSNSIGKKLRGRVASFMHAEWNITPILDLLSGIRYDNIGGKDHFSPRASLNFKLTENLLFGINYGHGFRTPTFNDLYWPDTQFAVGNPNLKPEISDEYEVVFKYSIKNYRTKVNIFNRNVRELIIWVPDNNGKWSPQNIARTHITGIGFENSIYLKNIDIGFSLDFFEPEDKTNNKKIRFSPKFQIKPYITYHIADNLTLSIQYYLYQQNVVASGDPSTYDTLNFKFSYKIKKKSTQGEIFLIGKNIFDRDFEYMKGYPSPGAQIYLGFSFEF